MQMIEEDDRKFEDQKERDALQHKVEDLENKLEMMSEYQNTLKKDLENAKEKAAADQATIKV